MQTIDYDNVEMTKLLEKHCMDKWMELPNEYRVEEEDNKKPIVI